jgi:hypothetical protein
LETWENIGAMRQSLVCADVDLTVERGTANNGSADVGNSKIITKFITSFSFRKSYTVLSLSNFEHVFL